MRGEEKAAPEQQKGDDDNIPVAQLGAGCLPHDWLAGIFRPGFSWRLPRRSG
jgi:hypothetical protein